MKQWIDLNGNKFYDNIPTVESVLSTGVYELGFDTIRSSFFLNSLFPKFVLPEKVYDVEKSLINRIKTTFNTFNKNFGVVLKGLKGTGKTITAKLVANELEIPVILVTKYFSNLGNFINSINQDIILMFDEFEKTYDFYNSNEYDNENQEGNGSNISNLLTLMDGVFTSNYRRLFILTTNKKWLPDAMVARPSRIRYIKDFDSISKEAILEILDDILENKEHIPAILEILESLEVITIDIVKSMAEEANLYKSANTELYSFFNIKKLDEALEFYYVDKDNKEKILNFYNENIKLNTLYEGYKLYVDSGLYIGRISLINTADRSIRFEVDDKIKDRLSIPENIINYRFVKTKHSMFVF